MSAPTPEEILAALKRGPATPDALAARLGGIDRDSLMWAVEELVGQGVIASTADADCGPDGICATSVPTVFSIPA